MPSVQARAVSAYYRLIVRRRDWGDAPALARRARRLFGLPPVLQSLVVRGLEVTPVADASVAPGVRGEWVRLPAAAAAGPQPGVLFYVHGGGYVSCSARTHRGVTAALARATGLPVFAADYRTAPEAPFPAALDDVLAAYHWLVTRAAPGASVAVAGESAGGGLALLLAQHARDRGWPSPACVAALSPWTDLAGTGASLRANDGRCALFRPENIPAFAAAYLAGAAADDPRASPLFGDAAGLPPVLLQVGSTELLADDARRMHARVAAAGGASRLTVYDDAPHGWHLLAPHVPEARAAVAEVAAFVRTHLGPRAGAATRLSAPSGPGPPRAARRPGRPRAG